MEVGSSLVRLIYGSVVLQREHEVGALRQHSSFKYLGDDNTSADNVAASMTGNIDQRVHSARHPGVGYEMLRRIENPIYNVIRNTYSSEVFDGYDRTDAECSYTA